MIDEIAQAVSVLKAASHGVALTGAGISVESGIPSFRDPGGFWTRYPPEDYATYSAFLRDPVKVWSMWQERIGLLQESKPNAGHIALAQLEREGFIRAVITQNVDNLHQQAGSRNVIEYHGNARRMVCLECGDVQPLTPEAIQTLPPRCSCGGLMKPGVVMFEEWIPPAAVEEADNLARRCGCMLVVGTSAQVYPAASLPHLAKERGAVIIEVNLEPSELTGALSDVFLEGTAGEILPRLVQHAVRARR